MTVNFTYILQAAFSYQSSLRTFQPAHLSATYEWHNQHNLCMKKHGEIHFQKQAALFVICVKKLRINMLMKLMYFVQMPVLFSE
jgi:hypothetical protein